MLQAEFDGFGNGTMHPDMAGIRMMRLLIQDQTFNVCTQGKLARTVRAYAGWTLDAGRWMQAWLSDDESLECCASA